MLKQLIRDSYNHYANKHMRKQWIRKMYVLIQNGNYSPVDGYKWVASRKVM